MSKQKKKTFAMSRRRQVGIFTVCVLLIAIAVWLDHSHGTGNLQPATKSGTPLRNGDLRKYHEKTFMVVNVVDGDTIDIDIPDGKYDHTRIWQRSKPLY